LGGAVDRQIAGRTSSPIYDLLPTSYFLPTGDYLLGPLADAGEERQKSAVGKKNGTAAF
jgi:hypothetical protein